MRFCESESKFVSALIETSASSAISCASTRTITGFRELSSTAEKKAGFAVTGGVASALLSVLRDSTGADRDETPVVAVDVLDKRAFARIRNCLTGKEPAAFIEVMNCPGGCIAGPGTVAHPRAAKRVLERECREKAGA
ncbi:MAG: [Fe-Fe] hydrogenase large subunit C-terminal domain-containing protein [Spirochaetia bacterium]